MHLMQVKNIEISIENTTDNKYTINVLLILYQLFVLVLSSHFKIYYNCTFDFCSVLNMVFFNLQKSLP